ncbi:uncharacterized protein Z520_01164 [Fonsecaea multimorphosa CBS 102226]|uniref:Uncharacterized protein n=1 Tax=Fonsecaea multimorphosa CBS 102226 TaxID=1442371 RepID=A0A0D2L0Y8_9EURO|nr:uncharacterized protein Z520_01164 [Fonsecaea multimorphosa CBS 102226]KIY02699.1 hypothetical protein Z520_01164 [Fonsecaea multimorphosa CBS 102226]
MATVLRLSSFAARPQRDTPAEARDQGRYTEYEVYNAACITSECAHILRCVVLLGGACSSRCPKGDIR